MPQHRPPPPRSYPHDEQTQSRARGTFAESNAGKSCLDHQAVHRPSLRRQVLAMQDFRAWYPVVETPPCQALRSHLPGKQGQDFVESSPCRWPPQHVADFQQQAHQALAVKSSPWWQSHRHIRLDAIADANHASANYHYPSSAAHRRAFLMALTSSRFHRRSLNLPCLT